MIDKNGKLFGKINIIDLLIVLIVLAAGAFVWLRFFGGNDNDFGEPHTVVMTFFADDAPSLLAGAATPGDPVNDFDNTSSLGTLVSYETEDAYTYGVGPDGEPVKLPVPNMCYLTFSCQVAGYVAADGLRVNGFEYPIGGTSTVCVGPMRVSCRLADVEIVD